VIELRSVLRAFAPRAASPAGQHAPFFRWRASWDAPTRRQVTIGLLDSDFDSELPDLRGAHIERRVFGQPGPAKSQVAHHANFSVALLVGQGHKFVRGVVPNARLLVGVVATETGAADASAVCEALDWLRAERPQAVAVPLGTSTTYPAIDASLDAYEDESVLLAACGNAAPRPVLFPARHPACIAVGAAQRSGALLRECSCEPRLDLLAPGWRIPGPLDRNRLARRKGSSIACVLATGALAAAFATGTPALITWGRNYAVSLLTAGGD
jgi:hypothetical protein